MTVEALQLQRNKAITQFDEEFKRNFSPQSLFSDYDLKPGEQALAQSALFREQGLQLYYGVPLRDLKQPGSEPFTEEKDFDYLVCRGNRVLLAIDVFGRNDTGEYATEIDGLPAVTVLVEQMAIGDVADILSALQAQLDRGDTARWECSLKELSVRELCRLRRLQMQEQTDRGPAPTKYGTCHGVVQEFFPDGTCMVCCSEDTLKRISDMRASSAELAVIRRQIPLAERTDRAQQSLLCNAANSAPLVREFLESPLETYMTKSEPELEQLRQELPHCATYSEVAQAIQSLLRSGQEAEFDRGVKLLVLLSNPIDLFATSIILARALPARLLKTIQVPSAAPNAKGKTQSLNQRVARVKTAVPIAMRLCELSMRQFFQGLGALVETDYPGWLGAELRGAFSLPCEYLYAAVVRDALEMLRRESGDPEEDVVRRRQALILLYLLLIEPACLPRAARRNCP